MAAFYNEIDPFAAQMLRNLIAAGHIAPGVVDERSIEDIKPEELYAFTQCHFFAGVGVWSYALRLAGWPDDRPIWTGSCPCQPFSAAGKGAGFADERHLWPAFKHLIRECKPAEILGEQVASSAADAWIDLVHSDMEAMGYAFGSVPFPSAGVGAPHIRDRNYWVAHAGQEQRGRRANHGSLLSNRAAFGRNQIAGNVEWGGEFDGLDNADHTRLERLGRGYQAEGGRLVASGPAAAPGEFGGLVYADSGGCGAGRLAGPMGEILKRGADKWVAPAESGLHGKRPGPTNGFWSAADWLGCRDGKWRPVEPGTFPLAHGAASRVGRLRAYGNAINAEAARVWIETVMECLP